tara:strand:+ start:20 stop:892 length:873 start_codon:yes stop_codon:yes gene_type:complete
MKTSILVIGGAGFVGSNLCLKLSLDTSNKVYSLDNYFTGTKENHVDNVKYIQGSSCDIFKLIDFKVDILFHLGEYSRVEESFNDIKLVYEYNKKGTYNVLEFVKEKKCKLIYSGSSTKFGDKGKNITESPYAWSKSSNVDLIKNYHKWFKIDYAITYFYNVYGRYEIESGKYATLIGIYKYCMKQNLPLKIVKPGFQKRYFTHIDDIVEGLIIVAKKGFGDKYGIGSNDCYSVEEIAQLFGGKIVYIPERKGNRMDTDLVTDKSRQLGWKPRKKIKDYITSLKLNNWIDV